MFKTFLLNSAEKKKLSLVTHDFRARTKIFPQLRHIQLPFLLLVTMLCHSQLSLAQYCTPTYNVGPSDGDYIAGVSLGTMSNLNNGGIGAYVDYTTTVAAPTLYTGNTYSVSIVNNPSYDEIMAAWIDFNANQTFEAGEKLGEISAGVGATVNISFTVPTNVTIGNTRMRVRAVYQNTSFDPCATYDYGQAEDYAITIASTTPSLNVSITTTPSTANFAWTTTGNYDWIVVAAGAGSSATAISSGTSANVANATGLAPLTNYDFYAKPTGNSTWVTGPISFKTQNTWGNALHFDGVNDYFTIGTTNTFNSSITNNATVEVWVKPDNVSLSGGMMLIELSGFEVSITQNGGLAASIYGNSNWQTVSITSAAAGIVAGQWFHIAVSYNGSLVIFYVNGRQVGTGNITGNVVGAGIAPNIGRHVSNVYYFVGAMDEIRIWNVTRTASQIQSEMNTELPISTAGLLAYYPLNEGVPNSANNTFTTTDIKSGANGTLTNFTLSGNTSNWIARSPSVNTTTASAITSSSATIGATYAQAGTATLTEKGFIWGTSRNLSLSQGTKVVVSGTNTGVYTTNLASLAAITKYYYRGYAFTNDGVGYTSIDSFVTILPSILMSNGNTSVATGASLLFYDSGGASANYSENEDYTYTFTPAQAGKVVQAVFSSLSVEGGWDFLYVYDGTTTSAPLIGTFTGTQSLGTITSSTGSLTFRFTADETYSYAGWEATISTVNAPPPTALNVSTTTTPSSANFAWAAAGNYDWIVVAAGAGSSATAISSGTSSNVANATGLAPLTNYDFYAKSTGSSTWITGPISFKTQNTWENALNFDGIDDYVNIGTNLNSFPNNTMTAEAWIYPTNNNNLRYVVGNEDFITGYVLRFQNGNFEFVAATNGTQNVISTNTIPLNQWSHVAGVVESNALKLYVNGKLVASTAISGTFSNAANHLTYIGESTHPCCPGRLWEGGIDEVRIWDVARTQSEIQAGMFSSVANNATSLLAYYPFNQGVANGSNTAITTATNLVAGTNGTLNGFGLSGNTSNWIARSPSVNTTTSSAITSSSATIGATYAQAGTATLTEKGFIWGTTSNLSFSNGTKVVVSGTNTGAYTANLSSLSGSTKYYYRGYAYSNDGVGYTSVDSFVTTAILMTNGNTSVATGASLLFYDSGGASANYQDNEDYTYTFTPSQAGKVVQAVFSSFSIEQSWDFLYVYDGTTTSAPLIGTFTGSQSVGTITSVTGSLTFRFTSDVSYNFSGWAAVISSITPLNVSITTTPSSANFAWATAGNYDWIVVAAGAGSSATAISSGTSANAANATGLAPLTNYDFYAKPTGNSTWVTGPISFKTQNTWENALSFDGVDDHVQLPAANYFGNVNFTIESWIYPLSFGNYPRLMDFGGGAASNNVLLTYANGQPIFQVFNGSTTLFSITSSIPVVTNQWAHIAATVNGNVASLYINGQLAGRMTFTGTIPNISLPNCFIGRSNWTQDNYSNVVIDEFRIWNVAHTQSEIQSGMFASVPSNATGLLVYYPFNQGVANGTNTVINTATNLVGGTNGTLNGFGLSGNTSNWIARSPFVNANTVTNLTSNSATIGTTLAQSGTASITEKGFIWGTSRNLSLSQGTKVVVSGTNTGAYTSNLASLAASTKYYYRGYAFTNDGVGYTSIDSFVTMFPSILMANGNTSVATGASYFFYDSGGASANYQDNENYVYTFTPSQAGKAIRAVFNSYVSEQNTDFLYVYNGNSITDPQVAGSPFQGTVNIDTLISTAANGALTFKFVSNASNTFSGWAALVSTVNPPVCDSANFYTAVNINNDSAFVYWYEAAGALSYNVKVVAAGAGLNAPSVFFKNVAINTYPSYPYCPIANLAFDTNYDIYIETVCKWGTTWNTAHRFYKPFSAPSWLATTNITDTTLTFNWNAVSGAVSYTLKVNSSTATVFNQNVGALTTKTITGLAKGTLYSAYLQVNGQNGSSPFSVPLAAQTLCPAVSSVSTNIGTNSITATWTAILGVPSYQVCVVAPGGSWNSATAVTVYANSITISGLTAGTNYSLLVRTNCSSGDVTITSPINFTTLCPSVSNIGTNGLSSSGANLTWTGGIGVVQYNYKVVLSGAGVNGVAAATGNTTNTSVTVSGLAVGTTYDVYINAQCANTTTNWSSAYTFSTLCLPVNWAANGTIGTNSAQLNWNAPILGAQSYNVKVVAGGAGINGTPVFTQNNINGITLNVTGLNAGTSYDAYAQVNCINVPSSWTAANSFTTVCPNPNLPTVSNISNTTATANITAVGGVTGYAVKVVASGAGWNGTAVFSQTVGVVTSVSLTGLTGGTNYHLYIQSICPNGTGLVSAAVPFTTICTVPTGLSITNLAGTTATLNWAAASGATTYTYKVVAGGAGVNGTAVATATVGNTTTANVTGLTIGTTYDFYVQNTCAANTSTWSSVATFTTICPPASLPTVSNIGATTATLTWTAIVGVSNYACKVVNAGAGVNGTSIATATVSTGTTANITGLLAGRSYDVYLRTNCASGAQTWTSTPVNFNTICPIPAGITAYNLASTTATISWTVVPALSILNYTYKIVLAGAGINGTTVATNTVAGASANITSLQAGTAYELYVRANCTATSSGDWSAPITFMTVCTVPTGVAVSNITGNSATVTWANITNSLEYFVTVVQQGLPINDPTAILGASATNTFNVGGLNPSTSYNVYVSLRCNNDTSSWTNAVTFATSCEVPTGINVSNVDRTTAILEWTPLASLASYTYKVVLKNAGINATAIATANVGTLTTVGVSGLNVATEYDVYVRSSCSSGTGTWSAPVSFATICDSMSSITISNITTNSAKINWATSANATGYNYQVVYNGTGLGGGGTIVANGATSTGVIFANVGGLVDTTLYDVYVQSICVSGTSNWSRVATFATRASSCPAPTGVTTANIGQTAVTLNWNAVAGAQGYDYWVTKTDGTVVSQASNIGNVTSVTITTGLVASTSYLAYIRAICPNGATGSYSLPVAFATLSATANPGVLTAAANQNDAYIDINWTLPPPTCLMSGTSPYSQGVYLRLSDQANNQMLYEQSIADLTPYIGAQQPSFTHYASLNSTTTNHAGYNINNTASWTNSNISAWTVETWVQLLNATTNTVILGQNGGILEVQINGQNVRVKQGNIFHNFSTALALNKWSHIALSYQGGTLSLYVNGVKKESKVGLSGLSFLYSNAPNYYYAYKNSTSGVNIAELRYWNRARLENEISDSRFVTQFTGAAQDNLLLNWRWSASSATTITDAASTYDGQNNSGTAPAGLTTAAYTATPDYTNLTGAYRHYVGPAKNKTYKMEVFQIGNGNVVTACNNLLAAGSTLAFQQPTNATATTTLLNKIRLQWTNKSKLSETFKISRDGALRAVIAGSDKIDSTFVWEDVYSSSDSASIKNGVAYNYCIQTYSNTLGTGYLPLTCKTGNTFNLNVSATDNTPATKVNLAWANVSTYGYNINIKREGEFLASLPPTATTYTDNAPIYGKQTKYEVCLMDANNITQLIADSDIGSVPPRGIISGRAVTLTDNYALKNVKITLTSAEDTTLNLSTYTDFKGNFSFAGVYYAQSRNFKVSASWKVGNIQHVFTNANQNVQLSDAKYQIDDVIFYDSTGLPLNPTPLAVTNFVATAVSNQDKINFAWNYTASAGDTVLYDLYREATKIATLTSLTNALSYSDLGGQPQVNYKYTLNAYKIQNGAIKSAKLTATITFPAVAMTTGFNAVINKANTPPGTVTVAWAHSSSNYSGFKIYRNGQKIADIPVGTFAYTDADAKPGTACSYQIKANRFIDNITFESFPQTASNVIYPSLPAVVATTLTTTTNADRNSVSVSWTIPSTLTANYNYDGFRIYRKFSTTPEVYIGQLPKGINPPFEDKTANPSVTYTYIVKTFVRLSNNTIAEAAPASKTGALPVVRPLTGSLTTDVSNIGKVVLSWAALPTTVTNVDGILIQRGTDTLAILPANATTYTAFTNNSTTTQNYTAKVLRKVNGITFASASISAPGKPAAGTTTPTFATNVVASQNLPNHIRLSWAYPNYTLSAFKVYRNNQLIATLPTENRVYIDTTAQKGQTYLYEVEAINGTNVSQKAGAQGRLKSMLELNGMLYSNTNKYGVPNVDVYLIGTGVYMHTKTDSSGYYVFAGLPETVGTNLNVSVDGYGTNHTATFGSTTQSFAINANKVYTKDFTSTYTPAILDTISPSLPINVVATANLARRRMAITWNTTNSDYSGFEVYRANVLLATVLKGSNLIAYDTAAYPGISYSYQVRGFKYEGNAQSSKIYGNMVATTATYPVLEAPIFVTATPNAALNTLKLTWSHNWDNHTYYEVRRNDSLLAKVNAAANLTYTDVSGVPGEQYIYSVTAVMQNNSKIDYSDAASISVQYPILAEVSNLTASTQNTITCVSNTNQERNFVDLNWTYAANAAVKGFRIYRDQNLLATLSKDSLHYRDYEGLPTNIHPYTVKTVAEREGNTYYSQGISVSKSFPVLAMPAYMLNTDTINVKQLRWTYVDGGADGFYIKVTNLSTSASRIDTVLADSFAQKNFVYRDKFGQSGTNYSYEIRAYSKRNEITYYSNYSNVSCLNNMTYPKPATPTNVQATDGVYASYVKISWAYPQSTDITNFQVYRDGGLIATISGGIREYYDLSPLSTANYAIRAIKVFSYANNTYTNASDISAGDNGNPSQGMPTVNTISFPYPNYLGDNYGKSIGFANNRLAVGGPDGTSNSGKVQLFSFTGSGFNPTSSLSGTDRSFGYVDAFGSELIVGQPGYGTSPGYSCNTCGRYGVYNINSGSAIEALQTMSNNNLGHWSYLQGAGSAVAISPTNRVIGFPQESGFSGEVAWMKNGANQNYTGRFEGDPYYYGLLGYALAINNDYTVVGAPGIGTQSVFIVPANFTQNVVPYNNSSIPTFPKPSSVTLNSDFGAAVNITRTGTQRIIVGAPTQQTNGAAYIAELTGGTWSLMKELGSPSPQFGGQFGKAVAIEGDYAVVGEPDCNSSSGKAYLYKRNPNNNDWSLLYTFNNPSSSADELGTAVEIDNGIVLVGAPKADNGQGRVYWINVNSLIVLNLSVTQGTLSGKTRLDWALSAQPNNMSGFKIYRDGALFQTVGTSVNSLFDDTGVPGKHYIYEVCAYTTAGEENRKCAEGWSKPDGYLEGRVTSLVGNGAIAGVNITAKGTVEGNEYTYTATTNANGDYTLESLYYGGTSTPYTVTAKYSDHLFQINPLNTSLSPQQKSRSYLNFIDKTSYTISGVVGRRNASCNLDSIRVFGNYKMIDGTKEPFLQPVYTTQAGEYSLVIDPFKPNVMGLEVLIDDFKVLANSGNFDTLHYHFKALQPTVFNSVTNFPKNTTLNFEDTLSYPVRLEILTACRSPFTGGNFKIRVKSKDDCFDKIFTTDLTGKVTANLPPLSYIMNVDGVENVSSSNQLALDFLRYRSQELDIYSIYKDSALYHESAGVLDSLMHQEFIYHRPPAITVLNGFDRYLCDDPNKAAIIKQGETYTINYRVAETFSNVSCDAKTGYIVIKNAGAVETKDTLTIDAETGKVAPYEFVGGNPNLVSPYSHTIQVEYRSNLGELLASKTMSVIVEGVAALPGADIVVDLGGNGVKLPMFTLRDPYGDGSSSTIEEGSTITKDFSISSDFMASVGFQSEGKLAFGALIKYELESIVGGGAGGGKTYSLSATTTQSISTSDANDHVGPPADVIVGVGIALQYGLVQEIKVQSCTNIVKTQRVGFAPHSVSTTWHYTVAQIEELIRQYEVQIGQIDAGTLEVQEGGHTLTKEAAKARYKTYKANWEQILVYHNRETLPWYNLCQKKTADVPEPYKSAANAWRGGFCPLVGEYDGNGDFQPKDKLVWDQELVTAYNNAMTAIRVLQDDYLSLDIQELPNWTYTPNALSDPSKYVDEAYVNMHGLGAENFTYGSGVIISKSYESAAASSTTISGSAFASLDILLGIGGSVQAAAGLGVEVETAEIEVTQGIPIHLELNVATEKATALENTNNISYTLVDDDDFDQFSVTVIQGIDPHQTPYFSLLGGRSSCPLEEGTIYRDNPIMTVYDPATESTSGEGTAYFVEPNKPATFYIQVSNQNPFNEERPVDITLDPTTNLDGAKVTIAGTPMYYGQRVVMFLPADEPLVIPVSVERGLWAYDYENLRLDIKPYCGIVQADDGENTLLDESNKTVYLNVHFKNECSPISIAEPDGYWTILKQDPTNPNSREVLPIRLMDYEPSNEHLMNVHLEFRRKGSSLTWNPIPNAELSAEELGQWNSENFLASQVPYYVYSWDITGDYQTYPDGEYEIRAVAECGLSGHVYSNITKGAIERKTNLYSLPQPSDHVWTMGDEISVAFNLDIDCAAIADSNFIVQKYGDNNRFLPGTVACANNKLIFSPELSLMPYFDGETLEMIVGGVHTANGNILDTVRWTFTVISRDIYVTKDTLEVELTQGQSATLSTMLVNNAGTGASFNYRIKNVSAPINKTWLSCTDSTGTLIMGSPQKIDFTINSKTLAVGTKNLYLDIAANGRTYDSAIYLKVKVLPATPNWVVNTSAYSDNMTVISNFYFDTNTSVKSTDTTDLISVWIGNEIRGVARISKFSATNYNAVIQVYGTSADASKALSFRVWDASAGIEYDARTTGTPTTIPFAINSIQGSVSSPKLLNILTASDKARYIPLNAGWTWFSGNTTNWNNAVNKSLASLRTPSNGDLLKTATKSATYSSTTSTWIPAASPANLDSTNVHRGYQIYLQKADTLRLTGAQPSISPISLAVGWNLIGVPSLTEVNTSALTFSANPTSASLKTIPRDKNNYSPNMFATYATSAWTYTSESKMNKLYPNFAYLMNVNAATQLRYPGYVTTASPVALRTAQTPFDAYNAISWATNAPDYEHNMLITANLDYNKNEIAEEGSLVAAYVGDECRGVGRLSYIPELNKKYVSMFVYSNEANETIDFRIYDAKNDRYFDNFEPITFHTDSILGNFDTPYRFSNVAPDNSFTASVYPNPFSHKFTLNLKSDKGQTYQVQLSDIAGHVIQSVKLETESSDISHTIRTDALDLPSGVYILQVKGSLGETRSFKLVHNKD